MIMRNWLYVNTSQEKVGGVFSPFQPGVPLNDTGEITQKYISCYDCVKKLF